MVAVYVNQLNADLSLAQALREADYSIEYLKCTAPDDGEVISDSGKYCITCADQVWKDVVERLRQSGKSLVYSVVLTGHDGDPIVLEAGELNSEMEHYTARLKDGDQMFAFWFEDCQPERKRRLAA